MAIIPGVPDTIGSARVLARFGFRLAILCVFAGLAGAGFGRSFALLSLMSAGVCVATALLRREVPFGTVLSHWDEAAVYGALFCLTATLDSMSVG